MATQHTPAEIAAMSQEERLARSAAYQEAWWNEWHKARWSPVIVPDWADRAYAAAHAAATALQWSPNQ